MCCSSDVVYSPPFKDMDGGMEQNPRQTLMMIVITMRFSVHLVLSLVASLVLVLCLWNIEFHWSVPSLSAAPPQNAPGARRKVPPRARKAKRAQPPKARKKTPKQEAKQLAKAKPKNPPRQLNKAKAKIKLKPKARKPERPKPRPVPPLQQLKQWLTKPYNGHPDRHKSHIQALMQTPLAQQAVVRLVTPYLGHKSWEVREKAAYTLSWLTDFLRDKQAIQRLLHNSRHDNHWRVRLNSLRALGVTHSVTKKAALKALLYSLRRDRYWQVRSQAARSIRQLGGGRIPKPVMWVEALNDPAWQVRAAVAVTLQTIQPQSPKWVTALGMRLLDPEPSVQHTAAQTLSRLGRVALPLLVQMSRSPHTKARKHALSALACYGKTSSVAVKALRNALRDPQWQIAQDAASALSQVGPPAAPAIPDLIKLLHSKKTPLRLMASWALQSIGPASLKGLRKTLHSRELHAKASAAETIGLLGPKAALAAPDLVDAMMDSKWKIRREAAWALYRLGPGGASYIPMSMIPVLINAVQDKQWSVRFVVAQVLGWMGPRGRMIIGWFESQKVSTVGVLKKMAKSDKDERVRTAARKALQRVLAKKQ